MRATAPAAAAARFSLASQVRTAAAAAAAGGAEHVSQVRALGNADWEPHFHAATVGLTDMDVGTIPYGDSADRLRALLRSGLLTLTDLHDNPERFFLAHRVLAQHSPLLGPGFWIRFTVHYNLFAGTVLALGTDAQRASLADMQAAGQLGCFALTERLAGVNSGLVVETIADWVPETGNWRITSPTEGSYKNWISQGLVADKAVVVADMRVKGQSKGPHAFVMDFRQGGELVSGVTLGDMGRKTVGNDLDNAWIRFDGVELPGAALLSRFAEVTKEGEYVQKVRGMPVFHMIGQRLFTGRVAVAQAALAFRAKLFEQTKKYTDSKKCWSPDGKGAVLGTIPQLRAIYAEADRRAGEVERFVARCESELCGHLRKGTLPPLELVEAIAAAKVKAVEVSIDLCFRLKQEVGSYALMGGTGFEQMDFLQCCKFAEGDSRILMQKMARDRMRTFGKTPDKVVGREAELCQALAKATTAPGVDKLQAWDDNWETVYALAGAVMERTVEDFMRARL
eukprot:TRINITY_DN65275_c0_g1_i1.p1 TRINITY_DN65275_c0_g1~~TRINITY_DN65275_c0_g1_i1.p1  ORF type:complete len:552 (+),score=180.23 TRINITY_DN65275_c0_g1_i1:127-1656(+)